MADLPHTVTDLVPAGLVERLRGQVRDPDGIRGEDWLLTVPGLVRDLTDEWDLTLDGPAAHGDDAVLLPVRGREGPAVLKLAWPHAQAREEHRALGLWAGNGAVRMLAAHPGRSALLLERLEPRDLGSPPVSVLESCEEIGHLARTLDRPAPPWLKRRASDRLRTLAADIDDIRGGELAPALPRRLLERGRSLSLDLATDTEIDSRLVHGALHQHHVLRRPDPSAWVAIAPHPIAADPTWVVAPALWHRWHAVAAAHDARIHLNLRLEVLCEAAGLDPDRARVVSELRVLGNAVDDVRRRRTHLARALTRHVTLVKALQPA